MGWAIDQPRDFINVKETGYRVLESEFNNAFKGKTIIDSNIPTNADPKVLKLQEEVKYVWNNVLSDQERSTVDILRIKYSEKAKWKKGKRTLGTHGGRKVLSEDGILISPSVLTIHLAYGDKRNDVLNTVAHELAHARWATEVEPNKEKMRKFTDKIIKMGKENALTTYAGSYFDDLKSVKEEAKEKWEKEIANVKNLYHDDDWGRNEVMKHLANRHSQAVKDHSENIRKAEELIANETHSEYFGMVSAPTNSGYHTVDTERLKAMSKLIKEDLYD